MDTQEPRASERLLRTSVLIPESTDTALRKMAKVGDRPLSREIRRALEDHVARNTPDDPEAALPRAARTTTHSDRAQGRAA